MRQKQGRPTVALSLATKAHRVAMSCRTEAQARVAWQWLLLAAKRDAGIASLLPYYAHQLALVTSHQTVYPVVFPAVYAD